MLDGEVVVDELQLKEADNKLQVMLFLVLHLGQSAEDPDGSHPQNGLLTHVLRQTYEYRLNLGIKVILVVDRSVVKDLSKCME